MPAPVALVVLDGFGCAPEGPGNAVRLARTPVFDALWERWPHTTLIAAGRAVGLPEGQMGNSEVGHLNIGAGRVVAQDLVRIGDAVADGTLASNPALQAAFAAAKAGRGVLHVAGLVSDGGVHSHVDHLRAIVGGCTRRGRPARRRARLHGRARRLAASGGRPARPARARVGRNRRGHRDRDRPLLRHGSRPSRRAHGARARSARRRSGGARRLRLRRQSRRAMPGA